MSEEKRECNTCLNQCMDMDMEPYCAAPEIKVEWPIGKNLCRGRPTECGPESKLWQRDTRRQASHVG